VVVVVPFIVQDRLLVQVARVAVVREALDIFLLLLEMEPLTQAVEAVLVQVAQIYPL
jgi:hypothetical protein